MRILAGVIALALVIGFTSSTVLAAKGDKKGNRPVAGKVVKVDGTNITVNSKTKAGEQEVVVATDANTKVTINGVDGKVADLKADMKVKVTPGTGTAQTIEATSGKAGGKKNK